MMFFRMLSKVARLRVQKQTNVNLYRRSLCSNTSNTSLQPRESMEFDVVVVGGGPAGLSAAIRLKQLNAEVNVCVVEKAAQIGSHIISGNVFDPRALNELIPDWQQKGAPLDTPVKRDEFHFLTESRTISLPVPSAIRNHGCYIISLGKLCRWLAEQAENLGVEVYPGFAANEVLYGNEGQVCGIATVDCGLDKSGEPKAVFQRGIELHAKHTLFAEGARGSLSEQVIEKFKLRSDADPQTYSLGIKEVWELDPSKAEHGLVAHTLGWPLDNSVYGGSFAYHAQPNLLYLGLVVGLDYTNPYLSPYQEMQRLKTHKHIAHTLEGGTPREYGARVIATGGIQSLPKLDFPGGKLIGCSAGFVNVPRIKGSHTAMKSGQLAAEAIINNSSNENAYEESVRSSWIYTELNAVRNVKPVFKKIGTIGGIVHAGLEALVLKGKEPWTFHNTIDDRSRTLPASKCSVINYPAPDGKLTFDIATSLSRSGTNHEDNQPIHLRMREGIQADSSIQTSLKSYDGPESRFCPAGVYEFVADDKNGRKLHINAQNCIHCKTCDIKTPGNYIHWNVPEGGGGPTYENM